MQTLMIRSTAELVERLPGWLDQPLLAFDTEFIRLDTFYPRLGLVQIGDRSHEYLIDPLTVEVSLLKPLLLSTTTRKVLHACSEDLEVLARVIGTMPQGILDTQIAAAFLDHGLQLGYQKSLLTFLGVDIPKDESRSNWLARPLTQAQLDYAALDVRHLPALFDELQRQLQAKGLWDWFEADCTLMLSEVNHTPDPALLYREVSNAWRLRPGELAVLRALTQWRELEARRRDMPRGFLIKNGSLFSLARRQPGTVQALGGIEDMTPAIVRRDGQNILALIAEARRLPPGQCPALLPPPLPIEARDVMDGMRAVASEVSRRTGVPENVLLRKRHAEALLLGRVDEGPEAALPAALKGWRNDVLTPQLLALLDRHEEQLTEWRRLRRRERLE